MTDRSINLEVTVPGAPEEVWEAVATGPGITSWFIPMEVEERAGGTVSMDFGSGYPKQSAAVTAWEPPHRVVFQGEGEYPLAYEWLVEARDKGTCVVRLVNSGFGEGDDWDDQYHGMTAGWAIFMENLKLHLAHFRGQQARTIIPTVGVTGGRPAAWSKMCRVLGVPDDLSAGDAFKTAAGDLTGTVVGTAETEMVTTYHLVLDRPVPGTGFVAVEGDGDAVMCNLYLYFYGDDADGVEDTWTALLNEGLAA